MSSEYSYDEQGQFFPFFVLTLTGLVTVPLTWSLLAPSRNPNASTQRVKTSFRPEHAGHVDALRSAQQRRNRRVKRFLVALAGWVIMGLMAYLIMRVEVPAAARTWNPYDILGISESATEKEIRRHYKLLSRKFHPDKVKPDPAKNETMDTVNSRYVDMSKAFQSLTDDEVRENYIKYGHPDGRQQISIGIALPKFIVSDGNGKYVVLVYTLLLGVLLPYTVGSWWYGTKRVSKDGVLMDSANKLFKEYNDTMDEGAVMAALSVGNELGGLLKGNAADSGLAKAESRILAQVGGGAAPRAGGLSSQDKQRLQTLEGGRRRKALALLWAYLGRVELGDAVLDKTKFEVGPIAQNLLKSFHTIALAYGSTATVLASYSTTQLLTQAMTPKSSPLLQLPHVTPAIAGAIEGDSRIRMTIQQFMELPGAERERLAVGNGLLSPSQYTEALEVARQLPVFCVAKAFFKVAGERCIIPSSLVTLVVKGRFIPPGVDSVPEINALDLEDIDPAEDDVEAIAGRRRKITRKGPDGKPYTVVAPKPVPLPLAFAPRFARDVTPTWTVFVTEPKQGRMAVPPVSFQQFDRPAFDAEGRPTFEMQTLKVQFAAPAQANQYVFMMHVVCDSYVGFDTKMEVTLVVDDAAKAAAIAAEDEISEADEDSIAGQMNALKNGSVPGATKPRRIKAEAADSDEESGTDEANDTSETNTDTEGES